jgi:hypothetical protein
MASQTDSLELNELGLHIHTFLLHENVKSTEHRNESEIMLIKSFLFF